PALLSTLFPYTTLFRSKGVLVLDISDPTNAHLVRSYDTPESAQAVAVSGDTLYVADGYGGILILTIPDSAAPEVLITYPQFARLDRKSTRLNSSHVSIS